MKQLGVLAGLLAMCLLSCSDDNDVTTNSEWSVADICIKVGKESVDGIHTEYFPSRTEVGIGFVDTKNGLYDHSGAGFENCLLTAEGTGEQQRWMYVDSPSFSGKAVAYYPYVEGIEDYSAIPVRVDGQTDYMYSGFRVAENGRYNLYMKHALTGFKFIVERGTYSQPARVEYVEISSEGLATQAMLDASCGKLSSITGTGNIIKGYVDDVPDEQALVFKFFAVPTEIKDNLNVSFRIDGQDYQTTIPIKEPFLQDSFTFLHFVLDDDGLYLKRQGRTAWVSVMKEEEYTFTGTAEDEYVHRIHINGGAFTANVHKVNARGFVGLVDWGDGCIEEYTTITDYPRHEYDWPGEYTVLLKGRADALNNRFCKMDLSVTSSITEVLHIGGGMGLAGMDMAFYGADITEIPGNIFADCAKDIESFNGAFRYCTGLKTVPEDLFGDCTAAVSFDGTFAECRGLESIPDKLFADCSSAVSFDYTFLSCTELKEIPEDLFIGCPLAENFGTRNLEIAWGGTFAGCTGITRIPEGLFAGCPKAKSFYSTFYGCNKVTSIPEGLFKGCREATDFSNIFATTIITSIPDGLFAECTSALDFSYAFSLCSKLEQIPEGLFDYCPEVQNFGGTFSSTAVREIPTALFDKNRKVTDFRSTFAECEHLTGESPYSLIDGKKVHLYERQQYSSNFAAPQYHEYCFWYGNGLTDYKDIPQEWK